jgi:hypothetical protein
MYDSVTVSSIPAGSDLVGAYVDGRYQNYLAAVQRFGSDRVVPIAVFSSTNNGIVGDCETGDMTPQTAVSWVVMRRKAGVDPTIYCSLSAWPTVQAAFNAAGVAQPHWWIAAYPGNGANLYPGSIAHQYSDTGGGGAYDVSVVADYWPGFDHAPQPGGTVLFPANPDRNTFDATCRFLWYSFRTDVPAVSWFDLVWSLWAVPLGQTGAFGLAGFGQVWDLVVANIHDTAGSALKGTGPAGPAGPAGPQGPAGPAADLSAFQAALVAAGKALEGA